MTPLDECSIWRRDFYLTTHKIHKKQTSMPPAGFEPAIPASGRLPYFVEIAFNVCTSIKHLSNYNRKNLTLTAKYKWHLCRFCSTEQTPSWRANNSSAIQEKPSFYGTRGLSPVYNIRTLVPVMSHINSLYSLPLHFYNIHFTIIFLSTPWPSTRPFSTIFLTKPRKQFPPHTRHPNLIFLDHPNNVWFREQITKLLTIKYSAALVPLMLKNLPQLPFLGHFQPTIFR